MKVTRSQLETLIENEVRKMLDETEIAGRASGIVKQLMDGQAIADAFAKLKAGLDKAGSPGAPGRVEEVALLLDTLGINYDDITKVTPHLRKDKSAPAAAPAEAPPGGAPAA